jgi:uncharacterized protein YceK
MKRIAPALLAVVLLSSGCASIVSGPTKTIQINATPGSNISIVNTTGNNVATGKSQMAVELPTGSGYFRAQGYQVKVSQPGYHTKTVDILPRFNPWYLGNMAFPFVGTIGFLAIDPVTGAFFTLSPSLIDVELEPTGQDIALINRENAAIKRASAYPVSRYDYMGKERAKQLKCVQLASPEVKSLGKGEETLVFECRDGRSLVVVCSSGIGCL